MIDEYDDDTGGFGDFFGDFLDIGIRPGHKVSMVGQLRYRQGSDPRDWSGSGAAKYLPRDWHMMCGSKQWTGAAATSGAVEVTFPAPFGDLPLILATVHNTTPIFKTCELLASPASSQTMEIYWRCSDSLTRVDIYWLALGPIGIK
jgi:hypothetical protein